MSDPAWVTVVPMVLFARVTPVVVVIATAAAGLGAQPRVTRAVAHLEGRDVPAQVIHITNQGDVALESFSLQVKTSSGVVERSWPTSRSPIAPGGTERLAVKLAGPVDAAAVTVVLAVYADGRLDGQADRVATVRLTRHLRR